MPNTRKKVIKTVYKEEDDSETEKAAGDFSDSGSEAYISEHPSSEEDYVESDASSGHEFHDQTRKKTPKARTVRKKTKFAKDFISKINKQKTEGSDSEQGDCTDAAPVFISVKDLTDADKLLPPVLNLSESDSSEDESSKLPTRKHNVPPVSSFQNMDSDSDTEANTEYKDVWSNNIQDNSEEIAKKTFLELEQHKSKIEETKASILSYSSKITDNRSSDVKDLLAQGEEVLPQISLPKKGRKGRKIQDDSDSDMEDWEEVKEAKAIPRQGLQLIVDMPDSVCRKTKKLDVEMMMKRKINRVKKEHQVFMHKVHVLCWIGHGNYVSRILNDQEVLTAALSLVPSKECYPGARVDMKYVEQITTWYKDKLTLKQDKNEEKYRPKALPLKEILLEQSKRRIVTSKKYLVFIFVSMLRALGLQCRVMFNFVTVPLKPPSSVLLSLSTKPKDGKTVSDGKQMDNTKDRANKKGDVKKSKPKVTISQVDGNDDSFSSLSESENIIQLDGNDDALTVKTRSKRATKNNVKDAANENEDVSPPKRVRKSPSPLTVKEVPVESKEEDKALPQKRKRTIRKTQDETESGSSNCGDKGNNIGPRKRAVRRSQDQTESDACHKSDKGNSADQRKRTIRKSQDKSDPSNTADKGNNVGQRPRAIRKCQNKTESDASNNDDKGNSDDFKPQSGIPLLNRRRKISSNDDSATMNRIDVVMNKKITVQSVTPLKTSHATKRVDNTGNSKKNISPKSDKVTKSNLNPPIITVTNEEGQIHTSQYFEVKRPTRKLTSLSLSRERSQTANPIASHNTDHSDDKRVRHTKSRTISAPAAVEKSKYFDNKDKGEITEIKKQPRRNSRRTNKDVEKDDGRVSHRDLIAKTRIKQKNDVTADLVNIIKGRVKEAKEESRKGIVKGKGKIESDDDSDFLAEEVPKRNNSDSDDDFKPTKLSPKPSTSRKPIDRRVLSSDEEIPKNRIDVWCEIFVEELEQWIAVDVIKGKAHCVNDLYRGATNPVCYVVGWDNNNYLKDLTRRYVPHWNTVTRKQRAEPGWLDTAVQPWLGAKTARDREEDEQLNRMQLEAPLPKSIAEYKNHPLYALKRHLLKFEALYPPDAVTLGFVRGEPVYARECVHVCRSRDTWLKEAKVVRLGEEPYKIVKARPKWDRLSNKLITDKPLEVFGPWQVQDYEPPVAENGVVPRNAYGNVELFKDCMLPKGTVHIKLPGLNRVAKKLNIDCAPAMTGFDFNGGWSHPVYNGFVVCEEFGELITDAWVKDQEEQERKEREKIEARVYGNWRRLVNGLLIRERLKNKYGFEKPSTSQDKKAKGPRLVVKKKS